MERPAIPALEPALVREFVAQAHTNLERVTQLIEQEPRLVNGAWDWGGGDWETGLGAAAHVGRADIARYLLAHGARMDLFAAAMLGELAVVQAIITACPEAARGAGPHGILLLAHAKAGGEAALAVVAYLESLAADQPA
jgi:hypothetical protein